MGGSGPTCPLAQRIFCSAAFFYTVLQEAKMWSAMPKHIALDKLKKIDIEIPLNSAFLAAYSEAPNTADQEGVAES